MSKDQSIPTVPPTVTNQDQALAFIRESDGFTNNIPGQLTQIAGITIPSLSSILPFSGFNVDFDTMLQKVSDFVKEQAKSQLSQVTGGVSDTVLQSTNLNT
jgi:hypothetical protein